MEKKATRTGTVEIKKCGFNSRPKLVMPGTGEDAADVDVLPDLFREFEGKTVQVTVEVVPVDLRKSKSPALRQQK